MFHIAWLGKKTPFCGNVSYGNSTTKELKERGYKISFIHFANTHNSGSSHSKIFRPKIDIICWNCYLPSTVLSSQYQKKIVCLFQKQEVSIKLSTIRDDAFINSAHYFGVSSFDRH